MEDKLFKLINPLSNLNFNTGFHSISSTTFSDTTGENTNKRNGSLDSNNFLFFFPMVFYIASLEVEIMVAAVSYGARELEESFFLVPANQASLCEKSSISFPMSK